MFIASLGFYDSTVHLVPAQRSQSVALKNWELGSSKNGQSHWPRRSKMQSFSCRGFDDFVVSKTINTHDSCIYSANCHVFSHFCMLLYALLT